MMRSIAASMSGSGWSGKCSGFEFGDRLVGKSELVDFAAVKHPYDDLKQPFVGGDAVGNRAGASQIIGGNGVSVAHHLHIQDANSTFDQHGPISSISQETSPVRRNGSNSGNAGVINMKKQNEKTKRTGRNGRCAKGKVEREGAPVF